MVRAALSFRSGLFKYFCECTVHGFVFNGLQNQRHMNRDTFFSIRQTEDRTHFEVCARIMCVNDPWVRYGMGYELCLQAFEGDFREIYILEIEDVLAGFAILQMTGTFKGYIQSLCLGEQWRSRGFGRKLLQFCEERILEISPNIFICVSEFNRGAIKLYD